MKRVFTLLVIVASFSFGIAQNIVPNYSFESYSSCPTTASQLTFATPWNNSKNSPEYLNSCSGSIYSTTPTNYFGYQAPATGNAYAGGLMYGSFASSYLANIREFLYVPLTTPLVIGQTYYVSFKTNLVDFSSHACNHIGIQFTTSFNSNFPINNTAHVYTNAIITDKTNWTTIVGTFVPTVAYNALMIGNFFDDSNTSVTPVTTTTNIGYNGYYFFDDVVVTTNPLVLPVNWEYANVEVEGNQAKLAWKFDGGNVASYLVERAENGKEFAVAQEIPAGGNEYDYHVNDRMIGHEPITYYRIRAILEDGNSHLSAVMEAKRYDADLDFLKVYPSPVNRGELVNVEFNSNEGAEIDLKIIDLQGRIVATHLLQSSTSSFQTLEIPTADLVPGSYWVKAGNLTRVLQVQ